MNSVAEQVNLFEVDEVCTHKIPNKLQVIGSSHQFLFQQEDIWKVRLIDHFKAEATVCKSKTQCDPTVITGKWSTIYDQAFMVELDNGLRFIANFRYSVKPNISANPANDLFSKFTGLKTGDYDRFDSVCDKTMIGFVQTLTSVSKDKYGLANHNVQCFYGEQVEHYELEKTVTVQTDSESVKLAVITS